MPSNETENDLKQSGPPPRNEENDSGRLRQGQKSNSVFDFLYHDHRRIASFLAQFETYGVLQQVKALEAVATSQSEKTNLATGLNAAIAKAGTDHGFTTGSQESDSAERIYDPLWNNARTFLNYLHEREMIVRDINSARIGQFVLVTGAFAAFDLGLLKEAWKLPAVKEMAMKGAAETNAANLPTPQSRADRKKAKYTKPQLPEGSEAGFEMMKLMPHTVQASVTGTDWQVWSTLREDSLIITGSELLLKHGVSVAGRWSMLGILDALPTVGDQESGQDIINQLIASTTLAGAMGQMIASLGPTARLLLGRPASAHGVTPLLIFRQVEV